MGDRSLGVMETLGDITPNTEAEVRSLANTKQPTLKYLLTRRAADHS